MLHILARFRERYPGIALVVSAGHSEEVIAQLYDYEAEVGILAEVPHSRDFEVITLSSTPLTAFTNRPHPPRGRASITLAAPAAQPPVLPAPASHTPPTIHAPPHPPHPRHPR